MQYNDDHANGDENDNVRGSRRHGRAARIYAEDHGHVHDGGEEGPLRVVTGQAEQLLFKAESQRGRDRMGEKREGKKQEESPSGPDGTGLPRVDRRVDASGRSRAGPSRAGSTRPRVSKRRGVLDSRTPVGRPRRREDSRATSSVPFSDDRRTDVPPSSGATPSMHDDF